MNSPCWNAALTDMGWVKIIASWCIMQIQNWARMEPRSSEISSSMVSQKQKMIQLKRILDFKERTCSHFFQSKQVLRLLHLRALPQVH